MRRVLVVSPVFPPADAPDMHRVRTTVGHYRACGWDPVVLCVRPEDTGRLIDPSLTRTVPSEVRVIEAAAGLTPLLKALRANDLGLRAGRALNRAGADLLDREAFDLVFISTTQFTFMPLGARWKRRFGRPFVLDFQDPWATYPQSGAAFFRRGLRHAAMRWLHRRGESATVPAADGLMAVSQTYLDLLHAAYPATRTRPAMVSPFGYATADFAAAEHYGQALSVIAAAKARGEFVCVFAGRVAPTMERVLAALFETIARGKTAGHPVFERLRLVFVGTGYSAGASERLATSLAASAGISDQVIEEPERVSFLDAWKSTLAADLLLVLGSEDMGFRPSKLNALLALEKPLICAAPAGSIVWREVALMDTVLKVSPDRVNAVDELAGRLEMLLSAGGDYRQRIDYADQHESIHCARRDCGLFDRVVAGSDR